MTIGVFVALLLGLVMVVLVTKAIKHAVLLTFTLLILATIVAGFFLVSS